MDYSMIALVVSAIAIVLFLILMILVIVLIRKQNKLTKRLESFAQTREGDSLELILQRVISDNKKVKQQVKLDVEEITRMRKAFPMAYRKMGIVKYDAFPGMTGKISSSVALLNEEDSGIIVNTMHSKEGCFSYVKEVLNGNSLHPLTKEDEEALEKAKDRKTID